MKRLFPLETDREKLDQARDKLLSVQSDAEGKEPTVETLSALATQFAEKRFVSVCTFIRMYLCMCIHLYIHWLQNMLVCTIHTHSYSMYICTIHTYSYSMYVCTNVRMSEHTYTEYLNTCT